MSTQKGDEGANRTQGVNVSPTHDIAKSELELHQVGTELPESRNQDTNTGDLLGVERIEATAQVWTKSWLIAAYALTWLVFFVDSFFQQASVSLVPYVTSSFGTHGLVATTSIVSTVVAGVSKLPLSRVMDVIGRTEGLVISLVITIIALVLMATCANVQTYAAGQVFFWTGMNNIAYVLNVFIADTTTLKNRMIMLGFTTTPYVPNTFAGPAAAEAFLEGSSWRWGYGAFVIIIPSVCAPLIVIMWLNLRKAKRKGLVKERSLNFTADTTMKLWWLKTKYWFIELDVVGVLLAVAGFSLLLLPFSLASYQADKWRSGSIISMLVIGVLCLVAFPPYEKYIAPKTFIRYELFKKRNVLAACLLGANTWISFYCYKLYFSSYLQVVYNVSVSEAGYIGNIFNIVTCTWAPIAGWVMRKMDGFKWLGLIGVPLWILFTGLMIHFRTPGTPIGLVVMCEVFTSFAGGTLAQVGQIAVQSSVDHADIATSLALLAMATSVGGAVGQSISGAIWTNTLPGKLAEYLPDYLKNDPAAVAQIYGDLNKQLSYSWTSPERQAIVAAYGETQKFMLIASVTASVGSLIWVFIMKDESLKDKEQTKGTLF